MCEYVLVTRPLFLGWGLSTRLCGEITKVLHYSCLLLSVTIESVCSFGRLPFSCYAGCPPSSCDSSAESCTGDCVSGCFCPPDLFQLGSQLCVEECIDSSMHSINKLVRYSECSGTNFVCMSVEAISGRSPFTLVYCCK